MQDYQFTLDFEVRDYECDMEGIVNNAVYQHYLEHTRHAFLKQRGLDFAELTRKKILLVVIRVEIDYLYPLRSGDTFTVGLNIERISRVRFGFYQDIFRLPEYMPIVRAKVVGTALNERGRAFLPEEVTTLFDEFSEG